MATSGDSGARHSLKDNHNQTSTEIKQVLSFHVFPLILHPSVLDQGFALLCSLHLPYHLQNLFHLSLLLIPQPNMSKQNISIPKSKPDSELAIKNLRAFSELNYLKSKGTGNIRPSSSAWLCYHYAWASLMPVCNVVLGFPSLPFPFLSSVETLGIHQSKLSSMKNSGAWGRCRSNKKLCSLGRIRKSIFWLQVLSCTMLV